MTKQCGNCEFWKKFEHSRRAGDCLYDSFPKCLDGVNKVFTFVEEGNDCPVYKERVGE